MIAAIPVPISEILIAIDRSAVDAVATTKAAIDRGCSLSKFLYLPKDTDQEASSYTFHCALFLNADFEGALLFLKEKALLPPEGGKLRVTGTGCDMYKENIAKVLGMEIEFVDEATCNTRGFHFLLSNAISPDDLFHLEVEDFKEIVIERSPDVAKLLKDMVTAMTLNDGPDPNARFPCIFILFGSAISSHLINADGTFQLLGLNLMGGKSLLGLGQALVGTNNYDEIMALAEKGEVRNVDTTVGEFLKVDPNSPYGKFPPDLPLFSFGKMINSDQSLESFDRADRACAVVRLFVQILYSMARNGSNQVKVSRVVVGGNGVRSDVLHRHLRPIEKMTGLENLQNIKFLKTGHTGAFGAMVSS